MTRHFHSAALAKSMHTLDMRTTANARVCGLCRRLTGRGCDSARLLLRPTAAAHGRTRRPGPWLSPAVLSPRPRLALCVSDGDTVPLDNLGLPGQEAIVGVSIEDAQTLDEVLSAGGWEDVQQLIRSLAMEGNLRPGVLVAARKVLGKASADASCPPEMVNSLTAVVDYLERTFEMLARMKPKAELAEALTELDPSDAGQRAQMVELMRKAFASGTVDQVEFMEDVIHFVNSADEQDAAMLAAVAEGKLDLQGASLPDIMAARQEGRARMSAIADIASNMAL